MASGASISGTVLGPSGKAAEDTRVLLVEVNDSMFVDDEGKFRFEGLSPGFYHIQAVSRRFGMKVEEVHVEDQNVELTISLGRLEHSETIVVTAGSTRGAAEIIQPVNVMDRNDLSEALQPTLGETLKSEPGMNSTQYGAGASRPVIRGQGGGRIRILENDLDIGDASVTSPDHAVAMDPLSTERVEIIRGPATLLYGNTAVGGVVNMMDERILDYVPQHEIGGTVTVRGGTVANERMAGAELRGGAASIAWYLNAFKRETDDYQIPGRAWVLDDPDSPSGTLPNSAVDNSGGTLGLSWVGKTGYVGASARIFDSLYGIPVELEEPAPPAPVAADRGLSAQQAQAESGVRIDMQQRRYDVRGGFDTDFGPFTGIDFRAGATDYEHAELEGGTIGTQFFTETFDGRVVLRNGSSGKVRGSSGLQIGRRDLEAVGEEAYIPPSRTDSLALFAVEELETGPMIYQFGLRLQKQNNQATGDADRDFSGASGSIGLVWRAGKGYAIGASLARTRRFPRAEELYADGPHLATASYVIGDVDLDPETSLGIDLTLRKREGRVNGELTLFANRYEDYIFEMPTGQIIDGLPAFQFTQADAEFTGVELSLLVELLERKGNHLGLEFTSDYTHAELTASGDPLPYIPPWRFGAAIHYRGARWHAALDVWYYDEQTRVPTLELGNVDPVLRGLFGVTPTDSYTMVGAHVGYRLPTGGKRGLMHEFQLRVVNLTDVEARNSVSRLKDFVPLPGRDVGLAYSLVF
jgi:iron complex outermembrane receptor protein